MKKFLTMSLAVAALAACGSYDYYRGGIRYVQDGPDCIYYADEYAKEFSTEIRKIDADKKIVYRNTRCADMYARDNFDAAPRHDRAAIKPTTVPACDECTTCGAVKTRKYIIVPAM